MSRTGRRIAWPLALMVMTGGGAAYGQSDPDAGAKVFNKCKACHTVDEEKNKVGPHLVGIIGRPAGSVEGFKYSDAMADSGIVWEDETLTAYLKDPKGYVPGNKMVFVGLKKDEDIADLLAYLHQQNES
jgi:cytochrome c